MSAGARLPVVVLISGGGKAGGRIVAQGTPQEIRSCLDSVTGRFI